MERESLGNSLSSNLNLFVGGLRLQGALPEEYSELALAKLQASGHACMQAALDATAAAESEQQECVRDMQALLDAEIATASAVLDHAAVEKAVAEQRCLHSLCGRLSI